LIFSKNALKLAYQLLQLLQFRPVEGGFGGKERDRWRGKEFKGEEGIRSEGK
jgi:hypothetical protein